MQIEATAFNKSDECSRGSGEGNCHLSYLPDARAGALSSPAIRNVKDCLLTASQPKKDTQPNDAYSDDSLSTVPDPGEVLAQAWTACHVLFCRRALHNSLGGEELRASVRSSPQADTDRILWTVAVAYEQNHCLRHIVDLYAFSLIGKLTLFSFPVYCDSGRSRRASR